MDTPGVLVLLGGTLLGAALIVVLVFVLRTPRTPMRSNAGAPLRQDTRELERQANLSLVRADDALAEADYELGFATAQFGGQETAALAEALLRSHRKLSEAFQLKQRLDDAFPETERQQRELYKQILGLTTAITEALAAPLADFAELRRRELAAPKLLIALDAAVAASANELAALSSRAHEAADRYRPESLADATRHLVAAERALADTEAQLDTVRRAREASAAVSVVRTLDEAEQQLRRAQQEVADAAAALDGLDEAAAALSQALESTERLIQDAKALPVPDDGTLSAALSQVLATLETSRAAAGTPESGRDPLQALAALGEATAGVDAVLTRMRGEAQRRAGAREALGGARVIAASQIEAARQAIGSDRGGVGAPARTRLAEAERQFTLAQAESDPVAALDAVRRANTHAMDAEALARYDLLGRR